MCATKKFYFYRYLYDFDCVQQVSQLAKLVFVLDEETFYFIVFQWLGFVGNTTKISPFLFPCHCRYIDLYAHHTYTFHSRPTERGLDSTVSANCGSISVHLSVLIGRNFKCRDFDGEKKHFQNLFQSHKFCIEI